MIPTYFPTMNCRRLIGFDKRVIAVLPSISSAMLALAVQTANSNPQMRIVASPQSISILKSSPNEKNGKKVFMTSRMMAIAISRAKRGCRMASLVVARAIIPARVM